MNPILLVAGIFLFVSGIVLGRQSQTSTSNTAPTPTVAEMRPTNSPTLTVETPALPTNTVLPSQTQEPKRTSTPSVQTSNLNEFRYPNAKTVNESSTTIEQKSTDTPSAITTWYESRIRSLGFSSRASAKTNTNGNVINKLGASKESISLSIEIKKTPDSSETEIRIKQESTTNSDVKIRIENNEPYL